MTNKGLISRIYKRSYNSTAKMYENKRTLQIDIYYKKVVRNRQDIMKKVLEHCVTVLHTYLSDYRQRTHNNVRVEKKRTHISAQ